MTTATTRGSTHNVFNWEDAFLLETQLTGDERMIRDTARAYAQEKLQPRIVEAYVAEKAVLAKVGSWETISRH